MTKLEWFLIAFLCLMLYKEASADELAIKMGTSATKEASSKVFGLTYQDYITRGFIWQLEQDVLSIPSDKSAATLNGSARAGVKVDIGSVYATATTGPGYISQRDGYLGGYFQFVENAVVGIQDNFGTFGVGYQHISSAGLEHPNKGRDYLFLQVGAKF